MIIAVFLIMEGELEVVKASITGSIIGNVLLVLGLAFLLGGWGKPEQKFNRLPAGVHSSSLVIAVVALLMPALFHLTPEASEFREEAVSIGVSIVLIFVYASMLFFSFKTHQKFIGGHSVARRREAQVVEEPRSRDARRSDRSRRRAERVPRRRALEPTVEDLGVSKLFVGLIVVPIVGNAAEHASAIFLAAKDKMDVAIEIAIGSSTQIALFVAPMLVFISLILGEPMNLIFTGIEVAAVAFSAAILGYIVLDGRSNWIEGLQLVSAYVIMAISFFFL